MSISPYKSRDAYFIYCVGQCPHRIKNFITSMSDAGVAVKQLVGRYEGQDERSFLSHAADFDIIRSWLGAEESVLEIYDFNIRNEPRAHLRFLATDEVTLLGRMTQVPQKTALSSSSYTYDPSHQTYFTCTGNQSTDIQPQQC